MDRRKLFRPLERNLPAIDGAMLIGCPGQKSKALPQRTQRNARREKDQDSGFTALLCALCGKSLSAWVSPGATIPAKKPPRLSSPCMMEAIRTNRIFDASNSGKAQFALRVDPSSKPMWGKLSNLPPRHLQFSPLVAFVILAMIHPSVSSSLAEPAGQFQYDVKVTNQAIWTDTGLDFKQGDQLTFTANPIAQSPVAQIAAPEGSNPVNPQGAAAGLPLSAAPLGALLARIGDANAGMPVLVGTQKQLTLSNSGRLYLGVNEQQPGPVSTGFAVHIAVQPGGSETASLAHSPAATPGPGQASAKVPLSTAVSQGRPADSVNLQLAAAQEKKPFVPAGLLTARNVQYPLDTTADGIVVFNVSINAGGGIVNISALNEIPPLTQVAKSSLQTWKFAPASTGGAAESSEMLVAFVFRHAVKMSTPPDFASVSPPADHRSGYTPPGISSAVYAEYPTSTVAAGAVVVQAVVQADGTLGEVKVVRSLSGGFDPLALKAARNWQMEPAMLKGAPIASKVAIAFVFSSRALNPF